MVIRIAMLLCFIAIVSCTQKNSNDYLTLDGFTQGTTFSIKYSDSLQRDFSVPIDSILTRIDESMSIYNKNSVITRVNADEAGATLDSLLADVIDISREVWKNTDGAFDITVGPVVRALGFGPEERQNPDTERLKTLLPLIGMDNIRVERNRLVKKDPRVQIDVNAIAQGYTVDLIGLYFEKQGIRNYLVEIGGEVRANGVNPRGTDWVVGVDKPIEDALPGENIQVKIKLNGKGLATSGNYRKFFVEKGVKYSHTINPKTGLPAMHSLLSATVVAPNATLADAYGTAFMVMGLEKAQAYLIEHRELEAYLIYGDSAGNLKVWMTEGMRKLTVR